VFLGLILTLDQAIFTYCQEELRLVFGRQIK
jgi:hypothetical protein